MKSTYILQPYEVGSKKSKSLALVIPAKVVKQYQINTSTAFTLRANAETNLVTLQQTWYDEKRDNQKGTKPAEQPFHGSTQQAGKIW
jgi:antitoxin component of MazEF toxin-antitoxin module